MGEGLERFLEGRRLSPVQRRIAHYLDEHLAEAVFLSSIELAGRAGVSQPSVTRFAMALGFTGYPELRQALRPLVVRGEPLGAAEVRVSRRALAGDVFVRRGSPFRDGGAAGSGPGNEPQAAVDAEIGNLRVLRERLAETAGVAELGAALAVSEPLPVLGLRVSSGPATTFAYYARRIHPDVRLLAHGGSEVTDGLHAARKAGADWLLAVVLPRYPAEAVQALRQAGELGLRTAVITDRADAPFPADVVLAAPVGERRVADSHAAPLALATVLVEAMADAVPLRTRTRLEEYERMTERMGVFLQP